MKPTHKRNAFLALMICTIIAGILIIGKNYDTDKSSILKEAERLFNKSILLDKDRREKDVPFPKIIAPLESTPQSLSADI